MLILTQHFELIYNLYLIFLVPYDNVCVCLPLGKQEVLSIIVSDSSHIYRAGPKVIFMRCPQGSAIITTSVHSGKRVIIGAVAAIMRHWIPHQ